MLFELSDRLLACVLDRLLVCVLACVFDRLLVLIAYCVRGGRCASEVISCFVLYCLLCFVFVLLALLVLC